jgi:hypothetical protein
MFSGSVSGTGRHTVDRLLYGVLFFRLPFEIIGDCRLPGDAAGDSIGPEGKAAVWRDFSLPVNVRVIL